MVWINSAFEVMFVDAEDSVAYFNKLTGEKRLL